MRTNEKQNKLDMLARRIKEKSKELDLKMLQDMVDGVRRKFGAM